MMEIDLIIGALICALLAFTAFIMAESKREKLATIGKPKQADHVFYDKEKRLKCISDNIASMPTWVQSYYRSLPFIHIAIELCLIPITIVSIWLGFQFFGTIQAIALEEKSLSDISEQLWLTIGVLAIGLFFVPIMKSIINLIFNLSFNFYLQKNADQNNRE